MYDHGLCCLKTTWKLNFVFLQIVIYKYTVQKINAHCMNLVFVHVKHSQNEKSMWSIFVIVLMREDHENNEDLEIIYSPRETLWKLHVEFYNTLQYMLIKFCERLELKRDNKRNN